MYDVFTEQIKTDRQTDRQTDRKTQGGMEDARATRRPPASFLKARGKPQDPTHLRKGERDVFGLRKNGLSTIGARVSIPRAEFYACIEFPA